MPYNESKSLTNDEVYAVVAYILNLNGIIADGDTMDAPTFYVLVRALPTRMIATSHRIDGPRI
jgi:hypothetical protein